MSKDGNEDGKALVTEINKLTEVSVEYIQAAKDIIGKLYSVSEANPLMGIVSALFTADFFEKINLMRHATAQALREAIFQAIGLSFDFSKAEITRAWINDIPVLGFFVPGANIKTETILNTSMTIDARGGETLVPVLTKLLETASAAGAAGAGG